MAEQVGSLQVLDSDKYDVLDPIIKSVYEECVKIDEQKKPLVNMFMKVMDVFIAKMKKTDQTFNQIFNRIGYTGSFYDGLRVSQANEYDLNLILKLKLKFELEKKGCRPGFIGIKVLDNDCQKPLKDWVVKGLLCPKEVKKWLQGVVTRTINAVGGQVENCVIKLSSSGPACTLKVTSASKKKPEEISIDLVPVIEFPSSNWPFIKRKSKKLMNGSSEKTWFAVPKAEDTWRISFPAQEAGIIKDLDYLKYTIKLLKKVRDQFNIKGVASYYIKTLFLWELERNKNREIWKKNTGRLFIHMLIKFEYALRDASLPFFWDEDCNLIGGLKDDYLKNNSNLIHNFIKKIDNHVNSNDNNKTKSEKLNVFIRTTFKLTSPPTNGSTCSKEKKN